MLTGAYLPGFRAGGPIRSLRNLQAHLGDEFEFRVVTADRDLGDAEPYKTVRPGHWNEMAGQQVFYFRPGLAGLTDIARALRDTPYDALYLNSFFSVKTTTFPLLLRALGLTRPGRTIVAPRGEFSEGALGLKAGKKQLFLRLIRSTPLLRGVIWHATAAQEAGDIQSTLGRTEVQLAANLPAFPGSTERHRQEGGPLRVIFLGRVNRMKNLDYALRVLGQVQQAVHFTIAGPHEDQEYWQECQRLIAGLPPHITVEVLGAVPAEEVGTLLLRQDALLLPTLGENYGHVIVEALTHGCVPIISDRTPWQQLQARQAGYSLPLEEPEAFAAAIAELATGELENYSRGALRYGLEILASAASLDDYRRLFGQVTP